MKNRHLFLCFVLLSVFALGTIILLFVSQISSPSTKCVLSSHFLRYTDSDSAPFLEFYISARGGMLLRSVSYDTDGDMRLDHFISFSTDPSTSAPEECWRMRQEPGVPGLVFPCRKEARSGLLLQGCAQDLIDEFLSPPVGLSPRNKDRMATLEYRRALAGLPSWKHIDQRTPMFWRLRVIAGNLMETFLTWQLSLFLFLIVSLFTFSSYRRNKKKNES